MKIQIMKAIEGTHFESLEEIHSGNIIFKPTHWQQTVEKQMNKSVLIF